MHRYVFVLLWACTSSTPEPQDTPSDSLVSDSDSVITGDTDESSNQDSEEPTSDDTDPALPADGFGTVTGPCGRLDQAALADLTPSLVRHDLDFGETAHDVSLLSEGGMDIATTDNRGGSSQWSEAISYDLLHRCEAAELLKTETEIDYVDPNGKKTDILVSIQDQKIGVSVTRAFAWPGDVDYTAEAALDNLEDKLTDVLRSSDNVAQTDQWTRQILHILAWNDQHADAVIAAYDEIDATTKSSTLVWVTVTSGLDGFVYGVDD